MSNYDYDYDEPRRHRSHRHRDRDDNGYVESRETYVRGATGDPPYSTRTDLIRRPGREDSDMSIEEVRRDFPPPGGAYLAANDPYGSMQRSRSFDRGSRAGSFADERGERRSKRDKRDEPTSRRRSLSRNQKIIAGVAGAALALGGKEFYDRRKNHGAPPDHRNLLATAAVGAAGAFAAYEGAEFAAKRINNKKDKERAIEGRHGDDDDEYTSDEGKKKSSRRKSIIEGALGLAGIGAAAKAASGGRDDKRNDRDGDRRSRRGSGDSRDDRRSKSRGPGGGGEGIAKYQQAAKAALLAGATEAFRVRNEPGGWAGAKGKRILTAAIGAGGIDAAADRNPEQHSKRHILEAVVGGLAGNRLINGSRNDIQADSRGRSTDGHSRSRSRAANGGGGGGGSGAATGLAALATAGLGALAGKKMLDRSKSRERDDDDRDRRRRSYSDDDDDRDRNRKRSKSVTDYARKGLAALGIGETAREVDDRDDRDRDRDRDRRRDTRREVVEEEYGRRPRRHRSPDDGYDDRSRGDPYYDDRRDSRSNAGRDDGRRARKKENGKNRRIAEGKESASDSSDLGSSTDDEKKVKKMRGKQLLTAGLAAVATIHAAHNVYQSIEKRNARHKAVRDGEMSPEEARQLKAKARLQDAASVGIAALGIKGAYSEWKEMREVRHEAKEIQHQKEERHQKRQERLQHPELHGHGRKTLRRRDSHASAPDLTYGGRPGPQYIDDNPYSAVPPQGVYAGR